jgi:D-alanyl-D-alanine carboxypeptidase
MNYRKPAQTTIRQISGIPVTTLLIVIAALVAVLSEPLWVPSSPTVASPNNVPPREHRGVPGESDSAVSDGTMHLPREHRGALSEADGAVPEGTTIFDDEFPGVANLEPALLDALRRAATDAADDGVVFFVNSGWRSPEYQNQLLREAVFVYGSEAEAARWVATAETSAHVSGDAVDIGPSDAMVWLSAHGARYGLCQIYSNEPWHYELRPDTRNYGCPPIYADPTQDPRMQQ